MAEHVPEAANSSWPAPATCCRAVIGRAAELGLDDRVHFAGAVRGAEVARLYRSADVCVMPSVSEPFGLVALESLRNGTPVHHPAHAGVAEVLRQCASGSISGTSRRWPTRWSAMLRYPALGLS